MPLTILLARVHAIPGWDALVDVSDAPQSRCHAGIQRRSSGCGSERYAVSETDAIPHSTASACDLLCGRPPARAGSRSLELGSTPAGPRASFQIASASAPSKRAQPWLHQNLSREPELYMRSPSRSLFIAPPTTPIEEHTSCSFGRRRGESAAREFASYGVPSRRSSTSTSSCRR